MVFRRSLSARPIQKIKHVIDSEGALAGAANSVNVILQAVQATGSPFVPGDVKFSATVNAFFLSIFNIGATGSGQDGSINWYIAKAHAFQDATTDFPDPGNTGSSALRNQIFHEEKGLAGSADGSPMVFKGVIVVPKGMRRIRQGDSFFIKLRSTDATNNVNFCIKAIYNEFQ